MVVQQGKMGVCAVILASKNANHASARSNELNTAVLVEVPDDHEM